MENEPKHPTYGTLDKLLAEIAKDIRSGYDLRIGLEGALHWFSHRYAELRVSRGDGGISK